MNLTVVVGDKNRGGQCVIRSRLAKSNSYEIGRSAEHRL